MVNFAFTSFILLFSGALWCAFWFSKGKLNSILLKIGGGLLAAFFTMRHLWTAPAYRAIVDLANSPLVEPATVAILLLIWFQGAAMLIAVLGCFFRIKLFDNLITYFALPIAFVTAILFLGTSRLLVDFTLMQNGFSWRAFFFGCEIAATLAISAYLTIKNKSYILQKPQLKYLWVIIPMLIAIAPCDIFAPLFGRGGAQNADDLSQSHRLAIYAAFAFLIVLYFCLRNRDHLTRRYAMLYIAYATLIVYGQSKPFAYWGNIRLWPLHLCNTAMYIMPLCLTFKLEKLFYFTYFINVLGGFIAILMPNYGDTSILDWTFISYWVNHWCAFFMPLLIVAVGIFPRPKIRHFRYSMVAFVVYFVFILSLNAYFGDTDFFFLNSDYVISKFPTSMQKIRNLSITIPFNGRELTFYPLYQTAFFCVYFASAFGIWFLYENVFMISENLHILFRRKKKIRQDEIMLKKEMGASLNEPVDKDAGTTIKISKFSKKYGSSKVFAVEDLDLEINGGEIFGFLGPNGSGKSTLIKSLVGLQPLTSGTLNVCGYDVEKQSIHTKRLIGFVPDHYALYEKLSGREYINYIADLYNVSTAERTARINHFLDLFELAHAFDNQIKTYSHGMKQKVAIMAALVHNPKVWILDEPLTGLDPNSIFQVKETMKAHAREGNIVFFSSHIMDVVEKICDRIAIIKKGHIICRTTLKEIEAGGWDMEKFYLHTIEHGQPPQLNAEQAQPTKLTLQEA